ncbi:MAG: alpha/beta hydrolase-fold protein [Calditrichia bacterium]
MFLFRKRKRQLSVRVRPKALPEGEKIYIVGNHVLFGEWDPTRVELSPQEDGSWKGDFSLPRNTEIEFKLTRGGWESEAVDESGKNLMNYEMKLSGDAIIEMSVFNWLDLFNEDSRKQDEPPVSEKDSGTRHFHRDLEFSGLDKRDLLVWLPPGYDDNPDQRYPVLYIHDGQNVFDSNTSYTGVAWEADKMATRLITENRIQAPIIVAVYNCASAERLQEYSLSPKGKLYLAFLTEVAKPLIDKTYRTMSGPEHTAIMGSSMGGLISFLAVWQYPNVFGKAACMSPSFIFNRNEMIRWLKKMPTPTDMRLYIDCGGVGGEKLLMKGCRKVLRILRRKKIRESQNFCFYRDEFGSHSEGAWAKRLWRPMEFLFPQ